MYALAFLQLLVYRLFASFFVNVTSSEDPTTPRRLLQYHAVSPATTTGRRPRRVQGSASRHRTPSRQTSEALVETPGNASPSASSVVASSTKRKRSKSSPPKVGGRSYSLEVWNQNRLLLKDLFDLKLKNTLERQQIQEEQDNDEEALHEKMLEIDGKRVELGYLEKEFEEAQKEYDEKYKSNDRKDLIAGNHNTRDIIDNKISVQVMKMSTMFTVEDCQTAIAGARLQSSDDAGELTLKYSYIQTLPEAQHHIGLECTDDLKGKSNREVDNVYHKLRGRLDEAAEPGDIMNPQYPDSFRVSHAFVDNLKAHMCCPSPCPVHRYYLGTNEEAFKMLCSNTFQGKTIGPGFRRMRLALHLGLTWCPNPKDIDPKMPDHIERAYKKGYKARLGLPLEEEESESESDDEGGIEEEVF